MDNNIDVTDTRDYNTDTTPIQTIKVVGVGGGGNNAVDKMFLVGIEGVSFVQVNTDRQVLQDSKVPTIVQLGKGRGAGGKPEVARKFAEDSADKIAEIFDDDTNMVFVTAGMGGGTGTGAAPVVARIAREKGILTIGIVTIPFSFEGPGRTAKALEGADEMAKYVDALLVLDNDRLVGIYPDISLLDAFTRADDTLKNAAEGITEIITRRGVINRDFNDVDATLRDGDTAIISSGYGEGPDRVHDAIQAALRSPLLKDCDIMSSKRMLMVLYGSCKSGEGVSGTLLTSETTALTSFVATLESDNIEVKWGLYDAPELGDRVKVTILASGFKRDSSAKNTAATAAVPTVKKGPVSGPLADEKAGTLALSGFNVPSPEMYDDDDTVRALSTGAPRSASYTKPTAKGGSTARPAAPAASAAPAGGITFDDI